MSPVAAAALQVLPGLSGSAHVSCLRRHGSSNGLDMLSRRSGSRPSGAGHYSGAGTRCCVLCKGLALLVRAGAGGGDCLRCGGRASGLRSRLSDLGVSRC